MSECTFKDQMKFECVAYGFYTAPFSSKKSDLALFAFLISEFCIKI